VLQAFLNYICGFLVIVSCVWRDYHNTPLFDMCNLKYHSKPWCDFSRLFLYTKHQCRDGTMLVWPDLCAYVACYILWFSYARVLLVMASNRWQKVIFASTALSFTSLEIPRSLLLLLDVAR